MPPPEACWCFASRSLSLEIKKIELADYLPSLIVAPVLTGFGNEEAALAL